MQTGSTGASTKNIFPGQCKQVYVCVFIYIYIYINFFNLSFFLYHCAKAKVKLSDSFGCLFTYSRPLRQKERVNVRTLACVYTEFEYIRASRE